MVSLFVFCFYKIEFKYKDLERLNDNNNNNNIVLGGKGVME